MVSASGGAFGEKFSPLSVLFTHVQPLFQLDRPKCSLFIQIGDGEVTRSLDQQLQFSEFIAKSSQVEKPDISRVPVISIISHGSTTVGH